MVHGPVELHAWAVLAARCQGRTAAVRPALGLAGSGPVDPRHLPVEPGQRLRCSHEVRLAPFCPTAWSRIQRFSNGGPEDPREAASLVYT